jgi:hypothetical protein
MKFPLAQEVSRHVRDKACKFLGRTAPSTATSTSKVFAPALVDEKVPASPSLQLIESNFPDLLLPTADLPMIASNSDETEFGLMVGEMAASEELEQVVEVSFSCKSCGFT